MRNIHEQTSRLTWLHTHTQQFLASSSMTSKISIWVHSTGTLFKQNPEEISYQIDTREHYSISLASRKLLCIAMTAASTPQIEGGHKSTLHKKVHADRTAPNNSFFKVNNPVAYCWVKPQILLKPNHSVNITVSINHMKSLDIFCWFCALKTKSQRIWKPEHS